MENKNHIYKIVQRLTDKTISTKYRKKILGWLFFNHNEPTLKDEALFELWNNTSNSGVSQSEIEMALQSVKKQVGIKNYKKGIIPFNVNRILKYAAIFIFPIIASLTVLFFALNNNQQGNQMIECYNPNGEQRIITLPDKTEVILNSGSLLLYPHKFTGKERQVYLLGEAFFDVKRNESHPFVVHTGRLNVKVLGTRFNLEAYPEDNDIATTLNKGKVKIYEPDKENEGIILKPDERAIYHTDKQEFTLSTVNSEDYYKWTEGELNFIQRPLSDIIKILERKYNVDFIYDDSINPNDFYTINFNTNENIEQVLDILISTIDENIETSINERTIYLHKNKKGGIYK